MPHNCNNGILEKVIPFKNIVTERLAIMMTLSILPPYLFSTRLAMLSKNKTMIADKVGDIRPIGILPVITKVLEKAASKIIQQHAPKFLKVGEEQAGFIKGRSMLAH